MALAFPARLNPTTTPASPFKGSRARGRSRACPISGTRSPASALSGPEPLNELLIFADSTALPEDYSSIHQNSGRGIRYHRGACLEAQDSIQAVGSRRRLQNAFTTLASFDYKAKSVVAAQLGTHHQFAGKTLSAQYNRLESYDSTSASTLDRSG